MTELPAASAPSDSQDRLVLPGERARLATARWVIGGYLFFGLLGTGLHIVFLFINSASIVWAYFLPSIVIALAAFLALWWLRKSLFWAMVSFSGVAMICMGVILAHELEVQTGAHFLIIPVILVGVFALGLTLGFRPAVSMATVAALILFFVLGIRHKELDQAFLSIVLVYAAALPAKVVEHLIQESTSDLSRINLQLRAEIRERMRVAAELREHREHLEELVQDRTAELESTNEELLAEVIERERAQQSLQQRTVELEARNEELDAFAHTVAHGLKNPLSTIIGFGAMLQQYHQRDPERRELRFAGAIVESGRRMNDLINELLLLARVREVDEIQIQPVDMGKVVAEAQKRLEVLISQHQAEIIAPRDWPMVVSHGPWLEEVWVNYITNAIKYGGRPPRVELGVTPLSGDGNWVSFWVRDNGPGLTAEEQERLFIPFSRLYRIRVPGHGLGLSIVRRIVDKLRGEVGVESHPGQGSVFSFALPTQASDAGESVLRLDAGQASDLS